MTTIPSLTAAGTATGAEALEVAQLSTTVTITAATISAAASDNSYNDSGEGFVAAGFVVGDEVRVTGFTGDVANNIYKGEITALTAGKMTIGGTDGDVIADDAAGESVTISKWVSGRMTSQDVADLAAFTLAIEDDGTETLASATRLNFTGAGVTVTDSGSGEAEIAIPGGGGAAAVNAQTGTSYTLVLGDANDIVTMDNAAANTLTVPANASVAFPVGTIISVIQLGAGATTITFDTGVTGNGVSAGSATLTAQHSAASLAKIAADVWSLAGDHGGVA